MDFSNFLDSIGNLVDFAGVFIIILGITFTSILFIMDSLQMAKNSYKTYREGLGKVILLGLEFLIAGDIIRSVVATPTITSAVTLGIIVVIRILLSTSLEMEVSGKWPWQQKSSKI